MVASVGDHGSFEELSHHFANRIRSIKQRDAMSDVLDAGHATTHRQFSPNERDVSTAPDITENILSAIYVHGDEAATVASRVPPRPSRAKTRGPER